MEKLKLSDGSVEECLVSNIKQGIRWGIIVVAIAMAVAGVVIAVFAVRHQQMSAATTATPAVERPVQQFSPVVADPVVTLRPVLGECYKSPMGDTGKVIGQDNDMLTMSFRGGLKGVYRHDQITPADCGLATR